MKKRFLTSIALTILSGFTALTMIGCKDNNKLPDYDYSQFFGICEVSGEINGGVDKALTHDKIADKVSQLRCQSFRIWYNLAGMFNVDENDELVINNRYYLGMKDHIDKLVDAGITNFLVMYTGFIYPKDYPVSTGYVVPDPVNEYDTYIRFLNLIEKAGKKTAELFPMIDVYEVGNEPDFINTYCVHKNGYHYGGSESLNTPYLYTDEEKASIIADMMWYTNRGVKSVNKDLRVSVMGLTNQQTTPDFLDTIYNSIESKGLPCGQEYSDTDPWNYFQVVNWHPYVTEGYSQGWVDFQWEMYNVCIKHNHKAPVYYSELGWTDWGREYQQQDIADKYIEILDGIKRELPFVEAVFVFRIYGLVYQVVGQGGNGGGEENFGIFYNPDDPNHPNEPKPAAIAIAKYFNGDDYELKAN